MFVQAGFVLCMLHVLTVVTGQREFTVNATSGDDVSLVCHIERYELGLPIDFLAWNGENIYLRGVSESNNPRYSATFNSSTAVYILTIQNVRVDDSARYYCEGWPFFYMNDAFTLNVQAVGPGPGIVLNSTEIGTINGIVNQSMSLVCESTGGDPPANITWWKDGEIISTDYSFIWNHNGISVSTAVYIFTPKLTDQGLVLECRVTNQEVTTYLSTMVTLYLTAAPSSVTITGPDIIEEGGLAKLSCVSLNSIPEVNITWEYNGSDLPIKKTRVVKNEYGDFTVTTEVEFVVERADNKGIIYCKVRHNRISAHIVRTKTILVAFGPDHADLRITHIEATEKSTKLYTCISSVLYPSAVITWTINGRQYNYSEGNQHMQASHGGIIQFKSILLNETFLEDTDVVCKITNAHAPNKTVTKHAVSDNSSEFQSSDVNVELPILGTLMTISILFAVVLFLYPRVKRWRQKNSETSKNTEEEHVYENTEIAMSNVSRLPRDGDSAVTSPGIYSDLQPESRTVEPTTAYEPLTKPIKDNYYTNIT